MTAATLDALFVEHVRTLSARMDKALLLAQLDRIAIYSGRLRMQYLDDQPYAFKVNPHFKAWAPLQDAIDSWILYTPGKRPMLMLHQPVDYWHKPPALPQEDWVDQFEVAVISEPAEARRLVANGAGFLGEWHDAFSDWGFVAINPPQLLERLHFERAAKTPYEAECLRRANIQSALGHRAAEAAFRAGASEYEIHLDYLRATGLTDPELPYPSIVGMNANAAILHYQHLSRARPSDADRLTLLIDAGVQFRGYASDITRTHAYRVGEFSALIEALEEVQQRLCAQVLAGTDYIALHLNAHHSLAQVLLDADFVYSSAEESVAAGISAIFFPHGLGHLLGLQVHDVGGFTTDLEGTQRPAPKSHPFLRLTRTLAPGFVVTIEPGIYFIESLLRQAQQSAFNDRINWRMVDRFRPYGGIRIEDNVLCTSGAPENLTRAAFAQLD